MKWKDEVTEKVPLLLNSRKCKQSRRKKRRRKMPSGLKKRRRSYLSRKKRSWKSELRRVLARLNTGKPRVRLIRCKLGISFNPFNIFTVILLNLRQLFRYLKTLQKQIKKQEDDKKGVMDELPVNMNHVWRDEMLKAREEGKDYATATGIDGAIEITTMTNVEKHPEKRRKAVCSNYLSL